MAHLPLLLELKGIRCLVVGAGRVAERKIGMLLRAGARVDVIAPQATTRIAGLARSRKLRWRRRRFRSSDPAGARLVFAVTSERELNREILRRAARAGAFCNVVDDSERCTMIVPAVLARGSLQIAVSTGGESPALAGAIRGDLARRYGVEYGDYVRLIGALRRRLLVGVMSGAERRRRYRRLLRAHLLPLLRDGRRAEARSAARVAAGFR